MLDKRSAQHLILALLLSLTALTPAEAGEFELEEGDTICLLGNALAERMQHHGWLEFELQNRFPQHQLRFRNLGFGGDELSVHQRTMNFGKFSEDGLELTLTHERFVPWDRYLQHCGADVVFAFFGYNESFAGQAGLPKFRADLESFIEHVLAQKYNGKSAPRLVLFSSIPQEEHRDPNLPDGQAHNERIQRYNKAMAEIATRKGVTFVDLFGPMQARYAKALTPLTINGIHMKDAGNHQLAEEIALALFGPASLPGFPLYNEMRATLLEKNLLWFNRYRATDGYNVYGDRSRRIYAGFSNFDVLQRELDYLEALTKSRDERIWQLAQGRSVPPDDSGAPALIKVTTNKPGDGEHSSHRYLPPDEAESQITAAEGMKVSVFADEHQFPELVNPVQMAWDTRGRLWVCVWATYPHWTPDQPMNDRVLILEDVDGDGRADTCTVFADNLHNPTGIEFWNGGVLLAAAPDLLFLKDTDGDDRADFTEHLLHGLSSADTHHSANSFVLGPDGALYFQEGTFHMSQVESIYGPIRNTNGCVWRFEPRTFRVERYIPYGFANPHGHVFDRWGQDFVTDGTGNQNFYSLPFSGFLEQPDKHRGYFTFFPQRSRPAGGTEILSSSHFPPEHQGNYLIANVIGFRGIFQYRVEDDGSGFGATELEPIVRSTDLNFRPVDIEMGPDGALYFLDWHNSLIGHLQHHLRDPNRDRAHGRVYRVTHAGRPLAEPAKIAGEPIEALIELLESPDDRVRYRARIELSTRDSEIVTEKARAWVAGLDRAATDYEHHLLEALWLHQQHNRMDLELLDELLEAEDYRARAAATRVLRYGRHHLKETPGSVLARLAARASDDHPRVRLEAVVTASFLASSEAATVALKVLEQPTDKFIDYALGETMRALEPYWREALSEGRPIAANNPAGIGYLLSRVESDELSSLPRIPSVLRAVLTSHGVDESERVEAAQELALLAGSSPIAELLKAIRSVDAGSGGHTDHTLHELGSLLFSWIGGSNSPRRESLEQLATASRRPFTRALGYAALLEFDGEGDSSWEQARGSRTGLEAWLGGVALTPNEELRTSLGARIRPLMFSAPPHLAENTTGLQTGSGLELLVFEPAPPNARLGTLRALTPTQVRRANNFNLNFPGAREAPSLGALFSGTLKVIESGDYSFHLASDDGSRLYIDERCIVDNDGPHSMTSRSGNLVLAAGTHSIHLTFFDSGGEEGLQLTWQGPSFEREPIADHLLSHKDVNSLRLAAILSMAHVPGNEEQKFEDAALLLGEPALLAATIDLLRSTENGRLPKEQIEPVVEMVAAFVAGLEPEARTTPAVLSALELGRDLAAQLPAEKRESALQRLEGLGGSVVLIRTLPHQMLYDVTEFSVKAGQPVSIVFQNNDVMPHNLVVTSPGAMAEVGEAAEQLAMQPDAEARSFIPSNDNVLWHTRLVVPGDSERLTFVAPTAPGEYPFVCTYPGHWRVMNGVMHVVGADTQAPATERRSSEEAPAPARKFVRNWTLAELQPLFVEGWERERSSERGHELFVDAGCIKCHRTAGEGSTGGPELTQIREKYKGEQLLQHILEPSTEVLEDYVFHVFERKYGARVTGRIVTEDDDTLHIMSALLNPDDITVVEKDSIERRWRSKLSPMPTGLLVTLNEEEILDLLYFLQKPGEDTPTKPAMDPWLRFEGTRGAGLGKHIVLLAGDEEYRSEEALPMLARILAEHHGFRCTVLLSQDKETGEVSPVEQTHIPGMHLLDEADMLVCFLRFRELPDEDMAHFVKFVDSGKPILGIRTATHAFDYKRNPESPYARYHWASQEWPGGFGQQILGDTWINHHGQHGSESTRGVIEPSSAAHPILRGVQDVWGPTDVYGIRNLPASATVLLRGKVLAGMEASSPPVAGAKNAPMMPLVWLRELSRPEETPQRIIGSTIGAATDCASEDLRRLFVNACYWGLGLEDKIPARSRVDYVVPYAPTEFGFGRFRKGVQLDDLR